MIGLQDKVVIVAGGGSGIGAATALRLAEAGAAVVIGDLKQEAAEAVAGQIRGLGGRALGVGFDVVDEPSVAALVASAVEGFGGLDAIHVNLADLSIIFQDKDALSTPLSVFDRTIAVDLRGHLICTRHAVPALLARGGGAIIYTVSGAAYVGSPDYVCYSMAKAGITALMRHVATRWGKEGIRANAVAPGPIWTPLIPSTMPDDAVKNFGKQVPMKRPGQPAELATAYVMLADPLSSYTSGTTIAVTGGKPFI